MNFLSKITERISAAVVASYVLAMALTLLLLVATPIGQDLFNNEGHLILGAFFIPIYTPIMINLLGGFLGLVSIFILCFVVALRNNGGFAASLRQFQIPSREKGLPNWLLVMPIISSVLVLLVLGLTVAQERLGLPTGSLPQLKPYELLYVLAYAPPLEETMFRISTLGLLVALRVVWRGPRPRELNTSTEPHNHHSLAHSVGLSFLSPEAAKQESGLPSFRENGWSSVHWIEWLVLALTSAGFGLAHVLSGAGWEVGKILPAAISGFVLGLSYLLYGAYASVLLHWFFNVYFDVFELGSSMLGGVFVAVEGLIGLLVLVAGVMGIISGIAWILLRRNNPSETTYTIPSGSPVVTGEGALYHRQVD